MRRILKWVLLLALLYVVVGAVAPFLHHPRLTPQEQAAFDPASVYGTGCSDQRVDIIADNTQALAERLRLISQAQDQVILSSFDFRTDTAGTLVLSALVDAADRGVQVRLIVDGVAGLLRMEGNPMFYALSAHPNAQVKLYNPIRPWLPWTLMGRLHCKYLVVDETAFVLGGRNTYDFFLGEGDENGWLNYDWDALVWSDGDHEGLDQVMDYFHTIWSYKESKLFHNDPKLLEQEKVQKARAELARVYAQTQGDHPDWFTPRDYAATTLPVQKLTLLHNPVHAYAKKPTCYHQMTQLLARPGSTSTLHTPYLICDRYMMDRLTHICEENADTYLMTNSIANNGNPFGAMDYRAHKKDILATGVNLLEYDSGVSYHGKCARMDDNITMIGSMNLDMRSVYLDTELMLVIHSEAVNQEMARLMGAYEEECLRVVDEDTSIPPEDYTPQEVPASKSVLMTLMRVFLGWSRFLL